MNNNDDDLFDDIDDADDGDAGNGNGDVGDKLDAIAEKLDRLLAAMGNPDDGTPREEPVNVAMAREMAHELKQLLIYEKRNRDMVRPMSDQKRKEILDFMWGTSGKTNPR